MSRMFRVITGAGSDMAHHDQPDLRQPADPFGGDVPFVEVGGPDGVVTSINKPPAPKPPAPTSRCPADPAAAAC